MADEVDLSETNGTALVVTAVLFLTLSYLSVFLRTYVRAVLTHGFQADDWLMLIAQFNYTLSCGFILAGVNTGLGHHNKALVQAEEIAALKWQALATATYISNMMFIKLSIGIFLLRLATERRYKYIIWGSLGLVAIMSTVLFFWDLFQCSPVQAQWDYTIPNLKCVTSEQIVAAAYALSIMTILTDWLYALLPVPMIWKVKMSAQAKLTVSVVLGLGIFASIATLVRLKFLSDLNDVDDILFAGTGAMVWTLIEPGVAISAASLVTIRPLLRAWKLKGFESTDRYGSSRRYGMRSEGTGTGINSKSRNRGMPGFGNEDYTSEDVELGDKTAVPGGISTASGSGIGVAYNVTPPAAAVKRPGMIRALSRTSEGTMGAESIRSGQTQYIDTPISTSPLVATNPFQYAGPLPNSFFESNAGPLVPPPPPTRPPQGALPKPPPQQRLAPSPPMDDPRRSSMTSEMFIIEGEMAPPMSHGDLTWVARQQHGGWGDRQADENLDGVATPITSSVDATAWIEKKGERADGGSDTTSNTVARSGEHEARDGAYSPL